MVGRCFDIPRGYPKHEIIDYLLHCIAEKGFCVLAAGNWVDDSVISRALDDALKLKESLCFSRPSSLIAPALLGDYGSAKIATLGPEVEAGPLHDAENLVVGIFEELRMKGASRIAVRSPTMLHETGDLEGADSDLDDAGSEEWHRIFKTQKLLCLVCLGPGKGTLELQPIQEEDAKAFDVPTAPGTVIVLRADILLHTHRSVWTSYIMTSFFLEAPNRWHRDVPLKKLTPTAKAFEQRHLERVRRMKEAATDDAFESAPTGISRDLQTEMNRIFLRGEAYAIHGVASKFGPCEYEQSFRSHSIGFDCVLEVPVSRWDLAETYDPDPESWKRSCSWTKHMSYLDGLEFFDNKFFQISPAEAGTMDPMQRQVLEVGYAGLHDAGLRKKDVMDSDTGFILAATFSEFYVSMDAGPGDLATQSNRFSFCLGMKGFNVCFDVDHASSLVAVSIGTHELGKGCSQVLTVASHLNFTHTFWPSHMQGHILSPVGRCCAFDEQASGSVRCDGVAAMFVKKAVERVDHTIVKEDDAKNRGVIIGTKTANQGMAASFTSPHGPAMCSLVTEVLKSSKISPLDVDIVECDAKGRLMDDAVEVAALLKILRPLHENGNEPLSLLSVKTSTGNSWYATGMQALLRNIAVAKHAFSTPILHLSGINPYCEEDATERHALFPTELLEVRARNTISGIMACGWGGTNAYVQTWGEAVNDVQAHVAPRIRYWPGGSDDSRGCDEIYEVYTIIGSWSGWSRPAMMHSDGDGQYSYIVTLGDNCWERFQILLDGNYSQVLHPGCPKAPKCTAVYGPEEVGFESTWMIDGRAIYTPGGAGEAITKLDGTVMDMLDAGCPGTRYRVTLQIAGRWRYVDWEKL